MIANILNNVQDQYPRLAFAEQAIHSVKGTLFPQEQVFIQNAVFKRQSEFIAGRILARQAMKQLGYPEFSLPADTQRCPVWPEDIVGSISHTDHYCGAVVGASSHYRSIGLDIEQISRINKALWPVFCTRNELNNLSKLPVLKQQKHAALVFSAKESFYKCHFYLHRVFFVFQDIEIAWNWKRSRFYVSVLNKAVPLLPFSCPVGFFTLARDEVFTLTIQKTNMTTC
ncbi:4'-phosphopantetheinyl transferase superfamily protein [bacterium]|nr:4'-phosphopantetheinyl transferase superfamily protein [bacterium]